MQNLWWSTIMAISKSSNHGSFCQMMVPWSYVKACSSAQDVCKNRMKNDPLMENWHACFATSSAHAILKWKAISTMKITITTSECRNVAKCKRTLKLCNFSYKSEHGSILAFFANDWLQTVTITTNYMYNSARLPSPALPRVRNKQIFIEKLTFFQIVPNPKHL